MPTRNANARWTGNLKDGSGTVKLGSGAFEGQYSFKTRFEDGVGTNPEELIAAAHAGCFAMAVSNELSSAGHTVESADVTAKVHLTMTDDGPVIPKVDLVLDANVPGIDEDEFARIAEAAKEGCPVSKVLAGAEITLTHTLTN